MSNLVEVCNDILKLPNQLEDVREVRRELYHGKELVTIAVLAYGKPDKTRQCVESIIKYTKDISYKLLLIDNGSPDEDLLNYYKTVKYENTLILHIHKNINGIYAIDKAKSYAESEYFVLVNNDIIVTENWLQNMLICAESDKKIGMVSPVSTNTTPEQCEDLGGFSDLNEMQEKAKAFNVSNPALWEEKIRLISLVALIRTEVFDTVGGFDMGFMHNFGDDDHSFRIRRGGYRLMLCRDVFVHHNHDRGNSSAENEMKICRSAFKRKFDGIDAWDDTQNSIAPYLDTLTNCTFDFNADILGIEARCGTPVLDIKNYYSRNGCRHFFIRTVTENPVFYTDLKSISDEVVCDSSEGGGGQWRDSRRDKKYNFIYCGKEINLYATPFEVLSRWLEQLKKNGYLFLQVRNAYDYRNFLQIMGIESIRDMEFPKTISYKDVMSYLQRGGLQILGVYSQAHFVNSEIVDLLKEALTNIVDQSRVGDAINQMLIKNYVIIARR